MAVTALLSACLAITGMIRLSGGSSLAKPLETIPKHIDGWDSAGQQTLNDDVIRKLRATSYLSRAYWKNGRQIDLFIAYYDKQKAGTSMHSPTNCLPGSGWEIWRRDVARLSVNGREFDINNLWIRNGGANLYLLYWYQSDTRITANEYLQKILLFRDTLLKGRRSESIVRIALPESPDAIKDGLAFGATVAESLWDSMGSAEELLTNTAHQSERAE